jgi:hypothetical protein
MDNGECMADTENGNEIPSLVLEAFNTLRLLTFSHPILSTNDTKNGRR